MTNTNKEIGDINHHDRGHAKFSPSGIKPLALCSGYHGKDGDSKASILGTIIHEHLETLDPTVPLDQRVKEVTLDSVNSRLSDMGVDDIDFDDEDIRKMNWIFHAIKKMEKKTLKKFFGEKVDGSWDGENLYEIQLDIDLGVNKTFGTCDRLTIDESGERGLMADYKTGISKIDDPRDNYQAITYAIGAFQRFPKLRYLGFAFYVPQLSDKPQLGVFHRKTLSSLMDIIDHVVTKASNTREFWERGEHPPLEMLKTNDHCRFCRHITECKKASDEIIEMFDLIEDMGEKTEKLSTDIHLNPEEYPEDIERLWFIAKRVSEWADEFKKKVNELGKEGVEFPTIKLTKRAGRMKVEDNLAFAELAERYGVSSHDLIRVSSIPITKVFNGSTDGKAMKAEAIEKDLVSKGADILFMQAPRGTKKKK